MGLVPITELSAMRVRRNSAAMSGSIVCIAHNKMMPLLAVCLLFAALGCAVVFFGSVKHVVDHHTGRKGVRAIPEGF